MNKRILLLLVVLTGPICFPVTASAATEVVQIGVASPQTKQEEGNVEQLRQRALRNAMDLAVLQVTGAEIQSERSGSTRAREETVVHDDRVEESSSRQNRFNTAVRSRTEGYARLIAINKEWQEKAQYYVEAIFAVETQGEILARENAGYYWQGAGRPSLGIFFVEEINGEEREDSENHTLRFLRDNMTKNGLRVSAPGFSPEYLIMIRQSLQVEELAALGTITMNCRLSFQVLDQIKGEVLAEFRASHGPDAGFTLDQAKENCLRAIAPEVSENLIRKVAEVMNDRWNNGTKQEIVIFNVPGTAVPALTEIINSLFRVTDTSTPSLINGRYQQQVRFKGNGGELAQVISAAFADEEWNVMVTGIEGGRVQLQWLATQ